MKICKKINLIPIFLIVLLVVGKPAAGQADTIRLRGDVWCPFNCDPKSDKPGYMIEIATRVFEKKGHKIDYQTINWARSIKLARQGKVEGIIGAAKGDAPDFTFPDNSLGVDSNKIIVLRDSTYKYGGVPKLKTEKEVLGVIKDYAYDDELDAFIKSKPKPASIHLAFGDDPLAQLVKLLVKRKITALAELETVFKYQVKEMGMIIQDFKILGTTNLENKSFDYYIAFSPEKTNPKSKEYAKILSDGVEELRKSGELKKILEKYGLKDWK